MRAILALAAALAIAAPAAAQVYHVTGDFEVTVVGAPGCANIVVTPPTAFSGLAANHGQIVGPITYTSDIPCASPPTVALTAGSVFVLEGNTLPTNLKFGAADVAAGVYPAAGNAATPPVPTATGRLKSILLPLPAPH